MIRRFVGAVAAALGLVAGLWLMLAPVALGTQPAGMDSDWNDPTVTEFVSGAVIAVVGLAGLVAFALAIRDELVRRGLVARPAARTAPDPQAGAAPVEPAVRDGVPAASPAPAAPAAPAATEDERVADLLAPLVRALAEDNAANGAHQRGGEYR